MANMGTAPHNGSTERRPRRFPRAALAVPVEIHRGDTVLMGSTDVFSAGGMGLTCATPLTVGEELWLRFNLPTGHSVHTRGTVLNQYGPGKFGIGFVGLQEADHEALVAFCRRMLGYQRRSERLARRFHLTVWRAGEQREQCEEMAETLLVSQHGGLMMCRAPFRVDEVVYISWPQERRVEKAKIVGRKESSHGGPVELAFEFLESADFWKIQFAAESGKWSFQA